RNENGITYRLPTEQEWERAASVLSSKSSKKSSGSPVKNDYLRNSKGCYMTNYYPVYGNFGIDGGLYPLPEKAYLPNDAGCYHMQGNVAEWTSSSIAFETGETGYLIKGGAWNLPESACNIGSRCIFPKTEQRSYVGFRMVGVPNKN
ncbi:MAG: formylglycine-generating enzyme family protein, partial [Sphingomonadales bacterium]